MPLVNSSGKALLEASDDAISVGSSTVAACAGADVEEDDGHKLLTACLADEDCRRAGINFLLTKPGGFGEEEKKTVEKKTEKKTEKNEEEEPPWAIGVQQNEYATEVWLPGQHQQRPVVMASDAATTCVIFVLTTVNIGKSAAAVTLCHYDGAYKGIDTTFANALLDEHAELLGGEPLRDSGLAEGGNEEDGPEFQHTLYAVGAYSGGGSRSLAEANAVLSAFNGLSCPINLGLALLGEANNQQLPEEERGPNLEMPLDGFDDPPPDDGYRPRVQGIVVVIDGAGATAAVVEKAKQNEGEGEEEGEEEGEGDGVEEEEGGDGAHVFVRVAPTLPLQPCLHRNAVMPSLRSATAMVRGLPRPTCIYSPRTRVLSFYTPALLRWRKAAEAFGPYHGLPGHYLRAFSTSPYAENDQFEEHMRRCFLLLHRFRSGLPYQCIRFGFDERAASSAVASPMSPTALKSLTSSGSDTLPPSPWPPPTPTPPMSPATEAFSSFAVSVSAVVSLGPAEVCSCWCWCSCCCEDNGVDDRRDPPVAAPLLSVVKFA
eukprot:UC1_evm3s583